MVPHACKKLTPRKPQPSQTQEDVHVREVAFVFTCVKDSPGAQYMLEMASLSQDSATSTQLQKYVS